MKKFGLLIVGAIAALILLANVGPLIGLAISLGILYYSLQAVTKCRISICKNCLGDRPINCSKLCYLKFPFSIRASCGVYSLCSVPQME